MPLGVILGAGGYTVKDMSGTRHGDDGRARRPVRRRTITDSPFFLIGPKVGFGDRARLMDAARGVRDVSRDVSRRRDIVRLYESLGPVFGKFDMRRPPRVRGRLPRCRDR